MTPAVRAHGVAKAFGRGPTVLRADELDLIAALALAAWALRRTA